MPLYGAGIRRSRGAHGNIGAARDCLDTGPVAYLKRVTGNLFFDYGEAGSRLYRSAGAETSLAFHAFSMRQPLRAGLRYA